MTIHVLSRLAELVARSRDLQQIYESALEAIMAAAHADRAAVLVLDETGLMRFTAWYRLSDRYRAAVEGQARWASHVNGPKPVLVPDVADDPAFASIREVVLSEAIRALAFIPLPHRERPVGTLMVSYDSPRDFSDEEVQAAATVAALVAVALDRSHSDTAVAASLERERAARRTAEVANQAKDDFLAMLAHELRNPFGAIVNAVGILERTDGQKQMPALAHTVIRRQTAHLTRLLDDLLDVARIGRGQLDLRTEPGDLRPVARLAVEAQWHRIEDKRQDLRVSLDDEPVVVNGDTARLQQVIGNLLNNACKYTPCGGGIWLTVTRRNGEAIVSVRDNGRGIPPERLDSIFDTFAKMHPRVAGAGDGLGLGLTLVKRLVTLHGGRVSVHSGGRDAGTEFTVRLPLATGQVRATEPPVTHASAPRRIVVIEDDDDSRDAVVIALQVDGHEVRAARLGREGVEIVLRDPPDLVLIDIGLPDLDGYEAARLLRGRLGRGIQLVALTGYGQIEDRLRSAEAGFDAHLVKPVAADEVLRLLATAMQSQPCPS